VDVLDADADDESRALVDLDDVDEKEEEEREVGGGFDDIAPGLVARDFSAYFVSFDACFVGATPSVVVSTGRGAVVSGISLFVLVGGIVSSAEDSESS